MSNNTFTKAMSPKWYIKSAADRLKRTKFTSTKEGLGSVGTTFKRGAIQASDWVSRKILRTTKTSRTVSKFLEEDGIRAERLSQKIDKMIAKVDYDKLKIARLESLPYLTSDQQSELDGYRYQLGESQKSLNVYKKYHDQLNERIKKTKSLIGNATGESGGLQKLYEEGSYKYLGKLDATKTTIVLSQIFTAMSNLSEDRKAKVKNPLLKDALDKIKYEEIKNFLSIDLPNYKELIERKRKREQLNKDEEKELKNLEQKITDNSMGYSNALVAYSKLYEPGIGIFKDTSAPDVLKSYSVDLIKFRRYVTEKNLLDVYRQSANELTAKVSQKKMKTADELTRQKDNRLFKGIGILNPGSNKKVDSLAAFSYLEERGIRDPTKVREEIESARKLYKEIKNKRIETNKLLDKIKKDDRFSGIYDYDLIRGAIIAVDPQVVEEIYNDRTNIRNVDEFRAALIKKLEEKKKKRLLNDARRDAEKRLAALREARSAVTLDGVTLGESSTDFVQLNDVTPGESSTDDVTQDESSQKAERKKALDEAGRSDQGRNSAYRSLAEVLSEVDNQPFYAQSPATVETLRKAKTSKKGLTANILKQYRTNPDTLNKEIENINKEIRIIKLRLVSQQNKSLTNEHRRSLQVLLMSTEQNFNKLMSKLSVLKKLKRELSQVSQEQTHAQSVLGAVKDPKRSDVTPSVTSIKNQPVVVTGLGEANPVATTNLPSAVSPANLTRGAKVTTLSNKRVNPSVNSENFLQKTINRLKKKPKEIKQVPVRNPLDNNISNVTKKIEAFEKLVQLKLEAEKKLKAEQNRRKTQQTFKIEKT